MLLHAALVKRQKQNFKLQAALAGAEIDDDDMEDEMDLGDDGLPPELLEMERERKRRLETEVTVPEEVDPLLDRFGYTVVKADDSSS